jgi:hypothetical protein
MNIGNSKQPAKQMPPANALPPKVPVISSEKQLPRRGNDIGSYSPAATKSFPINNLPAVSNNKKIS